MTRPLAILALLTITAMADSDLSLDVTGVEQIGTELRANWKLTEGSWYQIPRQGMWLVTEITDDMASAWVPVACQRVGSRLYSQPPFDGLVIQRLPAGVQCAFLRFRLTDNRETGTNTVELSVEPRLQLPAWPAYAFTLPTGKSRTH